MADRDRLSRVLSEALSRAVSDALDSALPQTCNKDTAIPIALFTAEKN